MRLLSRAGILILAGIVIGAAHSYYAPFDLRPQNNPVVPDPAPREASPPAAPGTSGDPAVTPPTEAAAPPSRDPATPPAPERGTTAEVPKPPPAEAAAPNYFITLDRAKELFDQGQSQHNVYFVDARPARDYDGMHVAGAMHLPPEAFGGPAPRKATDFLPGMTVVVYCHGANCTDSEAVMMRLQNLKRDIGPIYIMRDGFDPWLERNWPVEAGPDPLGR